MGESTELNAKAVPMIAPDDYGTTAPTTTALIAVDTLGFKWLSILASVGNIAGTSITIKAQGSATSGGTYADITGATFTAFGDTDDDTAKYIILDCHKLAAAERFVKLFVTYVSITASEVGAIGLLHQGADPAFGVDPDVVV